MLPQNPRGFALRHVVLPRLIFRHLPRLVRDTVKGASQFSLIGTISISIIRLGSFSVDVSQRHGTYSNLSLMVALVFI